MSNQLSMLSGFFSMGVLGQINVKQVFCWASQMLSKLSVEPDPPPPLANMNLKVIFSKSVG